MKIAVIGYFFKGNKITVSYDTVDEIFLIREEYKDDISIIGFDYIVESRAEVKESLERFKKDFNWNR